MTDENLERRTGCLSSLLGTLIGSAVLTFALNAGLGYYHASDELKHGHSRKYVERTHDLRVRQTHRPMRYLVMMQKPGVEIACHMYAKK